MTDTERIGILTMAVSVLTKRVSEIERGRSDWLGDAYRALSPVDRLKTVMQVRGMTINDVANRVGTSGVQVWRWVGGKHAPRIDMALQLARVLQVPVTDLWPDVG